MVITCTDSGTKSAFRLARLTPSRFVTRACTRSRPNSWPTPTSTAYTRRAPRSRSVVVKPPVLDPMSTATRSWTKTPNMSSACESFTSPRSWRSTVTRSDASVRTRAAGFVTTHPSTRTRPDTIASTRTSGRRCESRVSSATKRARLGLDIGASPRLGPDKDRAGAEAHER